MCKDVRNSRWLYAFFALALLVPGYAAAGPPINIPGLGGGGGALQGVLCTIVGWFRGELGFAIATLAVMVVGIGALMNKISWGMAIIVLVGISLIFGAGHFVGQLAAAAGIFSSGCGDGWDDLLNFDLLGLVF
jgi:type IV secretory pathway VirB2 component (pilin)